MLSNKTNQTEFEQKESQQEKKFLEEINRMLSNRSSQRQNKEILEKEQENLFLKKINQIIEDKEYSSEDILAIISHELNTPLVPILGYTDLLLAGKYGDITDKQKSRLEIIKKNTESLASLIRIAVDYQKIQTDKIIMKKTNSDILRILQKVVLSLETKIKQKKIDVQLPKKSFSVFCDPKRIEQVLFQLIDNSINAISNDSGKINIDFEKRNNEVLLSVSDNGIVLSDEQLTNIFSKLYQTDISSTREKTGIGMGLQLCLQIIKKHDGMIWAENSSIGGTTIKIMIPSQG